MPSNSIQLDDNGKLRHFLSIEGLNQTILNEILDTADSFTSVTDRTIKKVPILRGKTKTTFMRAGRFTGRRSDRKKAYVTLAKGENIDIFDQV